MAKKEGVHGWIQLRDLVATIAGLYSRSINKAVSRQTYINEVKLPFAMSEQSSRFQLSLIGKMPVPFKRVSHSFA